jgi:3alpha(or 20beta)-hydroxysteroid dehydrogenase
MITGGGNGMGRSHAAAFAAEGARVIVADVRAEAARAVASKLEGAQHLSLDVTSEADWAAAAACVINWGGIDVLVNNAGVIVDGDVATFSVDAFDRVWQVNVRGAFLGMRTFLPPMVAQAAGAIVNIGSVAALAGHRGSVAYGSSKWGLRGLSRSAALDAAGTGVRINTVHPGFVRTAMTTGVESSAVSHLPIPRFAEPAEISTAVLYLASDEASYCTGSDLVVDGGLTA